MTDYLNLLNIEVILGLLSNFTPSMQSIWIDSLISKTYLQCLIRDFLIATEF